VGEGTSPARPSVVAAHEALLAARGSLDEELVRLEASARAAIDVKAKIKRNPVKAAGLAAGAGFVVVGGPRKLFRRARRVVMGPEAPLPTSMLPREIDASLKKLGTDGEKVRGLLEHEFASYLETTEPARRARNLSGAFAVATAAFARPLVVRYSKHLADQLFSTDANAYGDRLQAIRTRLGVKDKQGPV
jgi:hypothetical protein